jgi:hypothetical protein
VLKVHTEEVGSYCKEDSWYYVVLLKDAKLFVLGQIFDEIEPWLNELGTQYPSDVSEIDAINDRGVNILLGIGMAVVMTVM